ncbi:MAG: glycosyltransferase [Micropepsaceae bacterium]
MIGIDGAEVSLSGVQVWEFEVTVVEPSQLTFITTCKGRLAHLQRSLPHMLAQGGARVVVVDYDCPDGTAAWVRSSHPDVKVVRVENTPGFNIARARNLGAAAAETDWFAFLDADILLSPEFTRAVLPTLQPNLYFRAKPVTRQNWGTVVCSRHNFLKAGGYDENYAGWGGEDDDFYETLQWCGARRASFPGALLTEVTHSDELRVRFHQTSKVMSLRINQHYRRIKFDLMNLARARLPENDRREIYQKVTGAMLELEKGTEQECTVTLKLADLQFVPPATDSTQAPLRVARMSRVIQYGLKLQP